MPNRDYEVSFPVNQINAHKVHNTPTVSLATIVALVVVGLVLRKTSGFHVTYTPLVRRFVFGILQPLTVLRSAWLARIDPQLSAVAMISSCCHLVLAMFWSWLFGQVRHDQTRGWLLVSAQGCLISFLYTTLGTSPHFGERAVSVCLMWDLAGNMWISQGLLYYLAALHAPRKGIAKAHIDLEEVESDGLITGESTRGTRMGAEDIKQLFSVMLVRQPTLPASLVGLFLGFIGFGISPWVDDLLLLSGRGFRYGLYLLLGLYATLASDIVAKRLIAASLSLRLLIYGLLAVVLWLYLPLTDMVRTTVAMTVLAPASTQAINLMAEFGYPPEYAEMSATVTTVSVLASFLIDQAVLSLY